MFSYRDKYFPSPIIFIKNLTFCDIDILHVFQKRPRFGILNKNRTGRDEGAIYSKSCPVLVRLGIQPVDAQLGYLIFGVLPVAGPPALLHHRPN
jgi:hypothetical protein